MFLKGKCNHFSSVNCLFCFLILDQDDSLIKVWFFYNPNPPSWLFTSTSVFVLRLHLLIRYVLVKLKYHRSQTPPWSLLQTYVLPGFDFIVWRFFNVIVYPLYHIVLKKFFFRANCVHGFKSKIVLKRIITISCSPEAVAFQSSSFFFRDLKIWRLLIYISNFLSLFSL